MKNLAFLLFFILSAFSSPLYCENSSHNKHSITYEGGDRFGDRALIYMQARYLGYVTKTPFLYKPFIHSSLVDLSYDAKSYEEEKKNYKQVKHINSGKTLTEFFNIIDNPSSLKTLFILDYIPTDISEWDSPNYEPKLLFELPWHDNEFKAYFSKTLSPKIEVPDFTKENCLNVAVHVRTLSGTDTPDTSFQLLPLKHPTCDYHKRQIKKVYTWNSCRPTHVHLFTDSSSPQEILRSFEKDFSDFENLTFSIQINEQADKNYVIQDFFAMQKFNVIIPTQSNFSMVSARMGNFDMVIFPIHKTNEYPNCKIDRVEVISKKSSWFPYDFRLVIKDDINKLDSY